MRIRTRSYTILGTAALLLLGGCTQSEPRGIDPVVAQEDVEIVFDTYTPTTADTKTRSGSTSPIDTDADLQATGFGVFCYYTGYTTWADYIALEPNFMYNQKVEYVTSTTPRWYYFPPKYWPNNDLEDGNIKRYNRLTFFAYAPYVTVPQESGDATAVPTDIEEQPAGITGITGNAQTGIPYVNYKWSKDPSQLVDLLYATPRKDLHKDMDSGEGYKKGKVELKFNHALARLDVKVQRLYEGDKGSAVDIPGHEGDTKIYINDLTLKAEKLYETATLKLDGTWASGTESEDLNIVIDKGNLNYAIGGAPKDESSPSEIAFYELNKWELGTAPGVDKDIRYLTDESKPILIIPTGEVTFTPTIQYSFVTRDNELALSKLEDQNGNKYGRVVNTKQMNGGKSFTIDFKPGKRYTLLIKIGVYTVEFEVTGVEDWDFPIRFNIKADDYEDGGTKDRTLDDEEWDS